MSCPPLQRTLPNNQYTPPLLIKSGIRLLVVAAICGDFLSPEVGSGFRPFEQMTVVAMPEAAVYEYDGLPARKDNIGLSRQILRVKPVAKSERVQATPDNELRLRVLSPDARHHPASGGG